MVWYGGDQTIPDYLERLRTRWVPAAPVRYAVEVHGLLVLRPASRNGMIE